MALTLLSVATIVMLVLAIQKQASLSTGGTLAAAATPPPPPQQSSVAFVADGYTSGSPAGGEGPANYTALLAAREGWRVTNPSVYGSGYTAGALLSNQVREAADAQPQLVVVFGGRADSGSDPAAVRDAALRLFQDLKTRLPQAKLVVIGPMWIGGDAPPEMRDVRDSIRDSATAAQLPYADPIDERWFNGGDQDGVTPDRNNLNDRGHRRLADLVDGALRKANVAPG